jgi:glycine dehydrogenase subunit 2
MSVKLLYEISKEGKIGYSLPNNNITLKEISNYIPQEWIRASINLPEVSEPEIVRHFVNLSTLNYGVDTGFYPLGSCTMKYNPKINEEIASFEAITSLHPLQEESSIQGILEILYRLKISLNELTGMDDFTLLPAAGAHGELIGMMIVKKYFNNKNEYEKRNTIIIPESGHGTNPASAASAGFNVIEVKSTDCGEVDLEHLKTLLNPNVAAIMLTNPNTAGVFETNIKEIAKLMHKNGSLLYYDGANLNALLGYARPGDMGFDIVHLNLHKTFSTPHGGGGPGSAPVGVKKFLSEFLPVPDIIKIENNFNIQYKKQQTIGFVRLSLGNISVLVKAYCYILSLGAKGLRESSEQAVLSANYIREMLKEEFIQGTRCICMHECVLSAQKFVQYGVKALDISKRLIDYGFHPPTNYFPLIIPEALMIEPTESESKETIDRFIEIMKKIAKEAIYTPNILREAPHNSPISRPDEVKAAKDLDVVYKKI